MIAIGREEAFTIIAQFADTVRWLHATSSILLWRYDLKQLLITKDIF